MPGPDIIADALLAERRNLVRPERFELPTYCSGGNRSIHLSYGRTTLSLHADWVAFNVNRVRISAHGDCASGRASAIGLGTVRSATRFYFQIVPGEETTRKRSVTVAPATTAAAPPAISTITEATAATTTGAFGLGPGFVHVECAPTDL